MPASHVAAVTRETPWSEAILAGLILQVLGMGLLGYVAPGFAGFALSFGFLAVGLVVSRRSTLLLRDFIAYALLTLASLSAVFSLVEVAVGASSVYDAGGALVFIASLLAALAAGAVLLTALRRSERVPYFG